jgi:tetratricopeptide (TPR) repeat protein
VVLLVIPQLGVGQQDQSPQLASLLSAAQQAQAANDYAAAAADYKQAVKLQNDIPELWANLGLMQHETGDYAAAIQSFQEANRLKPALYVPNLFLGIDYVHTGKAKDAIPLLLKAEKMNDADPLPSLTLGRAYSSLGEFSQAARELRHTVRLDAKQSSAWFALGIASLSQEEEDSRKMVKDDQDSSYAKALFAQSLVKQSRYKEAAGLYDSVLASKDQPPCMRSELGFLYLKQRDEDHAALEFSAEQKASPECMLALLGKARLRMNTVSSNENEEALSLLHEVWARDPGFLLSSLPSLFEGMPDEQTDRFLDFLSRQYASGKIDNAFYVPFSQTVHGVSAPFEETAFMRHASQPASSSVSPSAIQHLAEKDYASGHYGLCDSRLRNSLGNRDASALQLLATCAFLTGDYELSSDAGRELLALSSHPTAAALYWSIKANEKLAFQSLAHFEQLEPNSARSHILLGDIYRQRERYDDAQGEYAKALDISPNDPAALLGLAFAYFAGANVAKTIDTAQKALLQSPDDPEVNLLMGEALISQHKFPDAEPFLLKALRAKPQMLPHVHALLGKVYDADGKTQEAISELKMGLESDQDGGLHYMLARLYRKIGDTADADAALEQMKVLQQRRREGAVIAFEDSHPSSLDDAP